MTEDSGIVTGDSGQSRKSVTFNQNLRSRSVGTTGHVQTESAVNIARNTQHVTLPCGRVPQCWTGSPAWSTDSRHLSFSLHTPDSHAYAIYDVAPDGTRLTRLLAFSGTTTWSQAAAT